MSKVMIHPATYTNVRQAIDRAFELFPLKIKGKKVLIKPNVLRASEANEGIVTHPDVLRAVVAKVETLEPGSITVGDNPGVSSYGANEASFKQTGLMEAAQGYYQNIGHDSQKVDFKLPPLGSGPNHYHKKTQARLHTRTLLRPQVNSEMCTGCGTCVDQCAVSALAMYDHLPRVDAETCITCFCCQEVCPEKAITLE